MPLKNRQQAIPGGFDWFEPLTGWEFKSDSYTTTRDAILVHRRGNPRHKLSTDPEHIEFEMEQRYVAKLKGMVNGDQWLVPEAADAGPPVFTRPRSLQRGNAAGLKAASTTRAGIGTITDWLGSGLTPVDFNLAHTRAATCSRCPQNVEGDFWQRLSAAGAVFVKEMVQAKNDMKLITPHDDKLKSCAACSCWLPTKIWVPEKHILDNTTPETMAKLDAGCWVLSEQKSYEKWKGTHSPDGGRQTSEG